MNPPESVPGYPAQMGMIVLSAFEEIIGANGLNLILNLAGLADLTVAYSSAGTDRFLSFDVMGLLQNTLEQAYGPHGGRGLALRIGRACFYYGLRTYGQQLGLAEPSYRLLPLRTKLERGGAVLQDLLNQAAGQHVRFEVLEDRFLWEVEHCPVCWERRSGEPVCHLAVGFLQESLYWASGGKIFHVEETGCLACGDPVCTISADLKPLG